MRYAIVPLLVLHAALGCPSDDGDDDEGGEVGTGSTQSATSASQTGASSSGSATSASTGDGSAEGGNTTLPASCVGVGEDGPGPTPCPEDVGCMAECELDTATCCDATQSEWTCVCPDQEAPTSTAAEPCTWFSDACDSG
jgi:hypothetical protein